MNRRFAPLLAAFLLTLPMTSSAEMMTDQFEDTPEARWDLVTDGVMGGVSTGEAAFIAEEGRVHARMTGEVSTANNGGFIQIRRELPDAAPEDATGVRLVVRGNDQRYFVHLRTSGTLLPWQYYQAGFAAEGDWAEIRLPFEAFERSGALLRKVPRAESLRSLGIVAFGRDHAAEIEVREIGFY
ncbi:MAG: CIA30 family protein [Pseudomonadota bacterium]